MTALGNKAKYIRQLNDGTFEEGEGIVLAHSISPKGHAIALIDAGGGRKFNVGLACLNPSDDLKAQYKDAMARIKALEDDAQERNRQMVTEYNERIDNIYTEILGQPVPLDELTPPTDGEQSPAPDTQEPQAQDKAKPTPPEKPIKVRKEKTGIKTK